MELVHLDMTLVFNALTEKLVPVMMQEETDDTSLMKGDVQDFFLSPQWLKDKIKMAVACARVQEREITDMWQDLFNFNCPF